jgi:hypothetical protein
LGHPVNKHYNEGQSATKFPNGKPTWAKILNGVVGLPYIAMYYITRSIITSNSHIASGYSPILVI